MSFILSTQISEFSLLGLQTSPLPQLSLALEKTSALFISLPHSLKAEEKVSSRQNCHLHISAAFAFPPNWPTGQGVENQLGSEQAPPVPPQHRGPRVREETPCCLLAVSPSGDNSMWTSQADSPAQPCRTPLTTGPQQCYHHEDGSSLHG